MNILRPKDIIIFSNDSLFTLFSLVELQISQNVSGKVYRVRVWLGWRSLYNLRKGKRLSLFVKTNFNLVQSHGIIGV